MSRQIISNIFSSFADKTFTAVALLAAMVITVRLLPRSDFGIIGVVAGYGAFFQIINLALENVLLRDHRTYERNPEHFLLNFMFFNLIKALLIVILGAALAFILPVAYGEQGFIFAVSSFTAVLLADCFVSPLVIYASARYQQWLVTRVNVVRFSLNLLLLLGLFYWPTLSYLMIKDAIVMSVTTCVWLVVARKSLGLDFSKVSFANDIDLSFVYQVLTKYSLWVHFMAVSTAFIYRADGFILSFFVPLSTLGNYNVALTSANVANIAPSILGYQNSVAISHARDEAEASELTDTFLRISTYIGVGTLLGFISFGVLYLQVVTGDATVNEIYWYMICIVLGLVVAKTIASPLVAYLNIKGDVRKLFLRVALPVMLFSIFSYFVTGYFWGATGVAVSNITTAIVWVALLSCEIKRYGYRFGGFSKCWDDLRWVRVQCVRLASSKP